MASSSLAFTRVYEASSDWAKTEVRFVYCIDYGVSHVSVSYQLAGCLCAAQNRVLHV